MTPADAARQFAFASTVYRVALGAPASGAAVFQRWPDVIARPWFPAWPYEPLPAGVNWDRIAAVLADVERA